MPSSNPTVGPLGRESKASFRTACLGLTLLLASYAAAQTTNNGNVPGEMPQFKAEARQVLVVAKVWDNPPEHIPSTTQPYFQASGTTVYVGHPIHGLTARDFHLVDNGVEQKINYFQEMDFPPADISGQWYFHPELHGSASMGMWGISEAGYKVHIDPKDTYVLGFVPPTSTSQGCQQLRAQVPGHMVSLNRSSYCFEDSASLDPATLEGTPLGKRMSQFASSTDGGSVRTSVQAFSFRSSAVLSLLRENVSASGGPVATMSPLNYVVEVHDSKAPATVQIATEFSFPGNAFKARTCGPNPMEERTVHLLFFVYKLDGGLLRQFGDRYEWPCGESSDDFGLQVPPSGAGYLATFVIGSMLYPRRFNTQLDLPPGDYEIRVVVSDERKNFGRAEVLLHIDPFDAKQLTLSDIVLNGTIRDSWWAVRDAEIISPAPLVPTPLISKNIQVIPNADNTVRKHNDLSIYFEIYEPLLADQNPTVNYHVKVTDSGTGAVVMDSGAQSAAERITPGNVVIPIAMVLKTKEFKKGSYRLEVQATDSAGRKTEWKQGTFSIE